MKNGIALLLSTFILTIILASCAASTGSRYSSTKKKEEKIESKERAKLPPEKFDITPYRTKLDLKENKKISAVSRKLNAWYEYNTAKDTGSTNKTVIKTVSGYRVQVYSTDNLADADSIRTELYDKTNQKSVYISFDPPFYKVKVGDFLNLNDAKNMSFKLSQLGYSEVRVVNDTVNVFKQ